MKVLTSALFVLALVGPALAQPGSTPGTVDPHHPATAQDAPSASPGMIGMMGMMSGMDCPMMGGHTEGVLAFLRTELHITKAQTAAWDGFAAAYRHAAASLPQMPRVEGAMKGPGAGMMGDDAKATTPFPDRLSAHMQKMGERLAAMRTMRNALGPLYAAFSAEQKKTADRLLPMFTMMGGMM